MLIKDSEIIDVIISGTSRGEEWCSVVDTGAVTRMPLNLITPEAPPAPMDGGEPSPIFAMLKVFEFCFRSYAAYGSIVKSENVFPH
jgi:hypothetical protein